MNSFYALLAGVIQGLTEFLPISSSGHLVLFHDVLGFQLADDLAFDVMLHVGTLLALLLYFRTDVVKYLSAWGSSITSGLRSLTIDQRLAWYLLLGTLPAAIAGYLWEDFISVTLRDPRLVAVMLISFGLVLYAADRYGRQRKTINDITLADALLIGIGQVVALIPGVSRSGITIIAGLSRELNREAAARFSFLLSIPIVAGAGVKQVADLVREPAALAADWPALLIGLSAAAVVGYLTIHYFLRFVQHHSLTVFVVYRVLLGLILLGLFFM